MISAYSNFSENSKSVILQSVSNNVPTALLTKSADIISARLRTYGLNSFDVIVVTGKGQIEVQLSDDTEFSEIEGLLTSKGDLVFYETLERENFTDLINTYSAGKPLLDRSDIESINASVDKISQTFIIGIKFKPEAVNVWFEATKRNLNKHIAIVVDNQVFYSPVVRTAIEGGICEISGNLSQKESNYFLALVNNEPLPLRFTILK